MSVPTMDISAPGFELHSTDKRTDIDLEDFGFFWMELRGRDWNLIGGIKGSPIHFHTALRERELWAHIKNENTKEEISMFLMDLDREDIENKIISSVRMVNQMSIPEEHRSKIVKAWNLNDLAQFRPEDMRTREDLEKVYGMSFEVRIEQIHVLGKYVLGFGDDLLVVSHPQGIIISDYQEMNRIIREIFEPLKIYLANSIIATAPKGT